MHVLGTCRAHLEKNIQKVHVRRIVIDILYAFATARWEFALYGTMLFISIYICICFAVLGPWWIQRFSHATSHLITLKSI